MKSITALVTVALACAGCVAVPQTSITGKVGTMPFAIKAPKDGDLTGLEITADTNGAVHVHIDKLVTRTNPDVVNQTGLAQAQIITAVGQVAAQAAQAAAAGAVQGAK